MPASSECESRNPKPEALKLLETLTREVLFLFLYFRSGAIRKAGVMALGSKVDGPTAFWVLQDYQKPCDVVCSFCLCFIRVFMGLSYEPLEGFIADFRA